ncbi:hypothetical protein CIL05_02155 [Virgibacillus profundi]|uniref:General stress protein 17M-like domain-containing protein n=1 Tax=Virgibacillus profundi TaxID=2024555 RepID=A0A2A2II57_9BACI|nr:hypothetical protein [Virgibacillus profundi]PAV31479.1 hypothetical protein CIL05_02155 [Virgibacillus profundi]PXY55665.1 hypothetical protein CIT14_02165 [Virgibacillus profundi]
MTKNILAYFKSENDAESAKANLQRLQVSNLFVDEIPETDHNVTYVPLMPIGSTNTGTSAGGVVGLGDDLANKDDNPATHLLEGQVDEKDYEEAIQILADSKGYGSNE